MPRSKSGRCQPPSFRSATIPAGRKPAPSPSDRPPVARVHARLDARTYFLVLECVTRLFERDRAARLPDADAVIDIALRRAEAGRASVISEDRYNAWVAVVCRNAYLNFIRSRRDRRPLSDFDAVHDPCPALDAEHDRRILEQALEAAIDRLPRFLRDVARLRFLEQRGHRAISGRTGRTLPTTRAYANKAASRLRKDPGLRRIVNDWTG